MPGTGKCGCRFVLIDRYGDEFLPPRGDAFGGPRAPCSEAGYGVTIRRGQRYSEDGANFRVRLECAAGKMDLATCRDGECHIHAAAHGAGDRTVLAGLRRRQRKGK